MEMKKHHMLRKQVFSVLIISFIVLSFCSGCVRHEDDVPLKYQRIYNQLEQKLTDLHAELNNRWDHEPHELVFTTELLVTSANRGEIILEPEIFDAVIFNLDAMQSLGVTGVSLDIKYPVLVDGFPRQDEYILFYQKVVDEIKSRNLTLFMAAQVAFTDPFFGNPDIVDYYENLTLTRYKSEKRQMVETIINTFQPDYVTIENEPETQQMNTGLNFSVDTVIEIAQFVLNGLDKKDVKIGAGAGSWENIVYIQRLAEETAIDYLDIHIYPIQGDLIFERMQQIKSIALSNNKSVVIGETWLYKCKHNELSQLNYIDVYQRDVFSFWMPLDCSFLNLMVNLSFYLDCEMINPFWMQYFWGYVPYNIITESMNPTQRYDAVRKTAAHNMYTGNYTLVGQTYKNLIDRYS